MTTVPCQAAQAIDPTRKGVRLAGRSRDLHMSIRPVVIRSDDVAVEGWDAAERGVVTWRTLVSGDRTPSRSLTLGVADVGEPVAGPPVLHRHDEDEVYYILAGAGLIRIGDQDHKLAEGDAVFVPGGVWHAAWATGPEPLKILYVFAADRFNQIVYTFQEPAG